MSRQNKSKSLVGNQHKAFIKAARELGCDESEARFNEALRNLVKDPNDKKALDKLADELGQNDLPGQSKA